MFFPLTVLGYFVVPYRYRWCLLLIASYYFYMSWCPVYGLLLLLTTGIDYAAGLMIERAANPWRHRAWLLVSLASNLGGLGFFKYYGFFSQSVADLLAWLGGSPTAVPRLDILLPVGISFYTFQSMSYAIDVYRGVQKAEPHFGYFALYVSFWPQLVAGPIERSTSLLPQLKQAYQFDARRVADGLKRMLWGFFKKLVIADRLALFVTAVYAQPAEYTGFTLLLATVGFAFQIYCDFSGYSDIALGSAQVMGVRLMRNFRSPYFSGSIPEFWQRWHISLSTWFRDYVYIPLGGNRVPRWRWAVNVAVVFLLSGLWHGANWTFVVWGAIHGLFYLLTSLVRPLLPRHERSNSQFVQGLWHLTSVGLTFAITCVAWVFFRAQSLSDAWYILSAIATDLDLPLTIRELRQTVMLGGVTTTDAQIIAAAILLMEGVQLVQLRGSVRERLRIWPGWIRWPVYYSLILGLLAFGVFSGQNFIYFQF
jgi:D-alanyl-lipoteichoic acid acyltransferase DltB (MBOAT superfamily)